MTTFTERHYRQRVKAADLVSFHVVIKETDLWVMADRNLEKETKDLVFDCRQKLEDYIRSHDAFLTTLQPYPVDPYAPDLIKTMIGTTRRLGVGPMASVAGAIAQFVGEGLLRTTDQVIVENGGDIYLRTKRPVTVSIYAGESIFSERIGVKIPPHQMPVGVCSSSATIGHSLSMGSADLVCTIAQSAALADGVATALCNRVKDKKDLEEIPGWAANIKGIIGVLAVMGDRMLPWGDIELVGL
jgi:ApbE superfamily uncharacterized protein (UPF0280 family)